MLLLLDNSSNSSNSSIKTNRRERQSFETRSALGSLPTKDREEASWGVDFNEIVDWRIKLMKKYKRKGKETTALRSGTGITMAQGCWGAGMILSVVVVVSIMET